MENEEGKVPLKKKAKIGEKTNNKQGKSKVLRGEDEYESLGEDEYEYPDLSCGMRVSVYKKSLIKEDPNQKKKKTYPNPTAICHTTGLSEEDAQKMMNRSHRFFRSIHAYYFTEDYVFAKGRKICISSEFEYVTPIGEYCFDSSWVAVHGLDTICMVTCRKDMDMERLSSYDRSFCNAVLSEVECLQYKDRKYNKDILRKHCGSKVVNPYGVVSLVLTTGKSWEESTEPVINFLKQKMKDSRSTSTDYKTLQTAIGAYQHMCSGRVLSAEDILVAIMDLSPGRVNYLDIKIITEQLDIVNGRRSHRKCPKTPLVFRHSHAPNPSSRLRGSNARRLMKLSSS